MTANSFNSKRFFNKSFDEVRVKVCGVKIEPDALAAIESGADALGFNLYPGSKRYIKWEKEADWIRALPSEVARVAVLVNPTIDEARELLDIDLFDALQFHGEESKEFFEALPAHDKPLIKAVRLTSVAVLEQVRRYPVFGLLADGSREGEFGGTGVRFDWSLLQGANIDKVLIVAGGLTPENVADAIRETRPYAVDVASGVENREGLKDKNKMVKFILSARGVRKCAIRAL
ncbi:MAG TPA: phosphoribosylanthranilate isomerase [Chthoniobacterales bacterium]|nr:phosphoribosylanthranilate isomerase [Chthoniobacterales bacterium]